MIGRCKLLAAAIFALGLIASAIGCGASRRFGNQLPAADGARAAATQATSTDVAYVVHISVDGLNSAELRALLQDDQSQRFAGFQRLIVEGASTFNARTDSTHTVTLPNHTTMLTGRPVQRPAGMPDTIHHGYINNRNVAVHDTLHNGGNPQLAYVPSVFDVVHDHGLSTALFASKAKFAIFDQSYNSDNGAPDGVGADEGRDKIDFAVIQAHSTSAAMHVELMVHLPRLRPNYSFVHYREPDSAGHAFGWGSAEWGEAVAAVSRYLSQLLAVIESDVELAGRTAIIVTTDHGGGAPSRSHWVAISAENYTIPVFVWGPGVMQSADLYALNPQRRDPGTRRPSYSAPGQPIRNGDTGTLALHLLGLPSIEGSLLNEPLNVAP